MINYCISKNLQQNGESYCSITFIILSFLNMDMGYYGVFLCLQDMLCSFFNIIGYVHENFLKFISYFLIICDVGLTKCFLIPFRDPSTGFFCYAQGYSTHFFCVASFLWTTTIAFTLHRTVVQHKADVEDLEPVFHTYVWGMNRWDNF